MNRSRNGMGPSTYAPLLSLVLGLGCAGESKFAANFAPDFDVRHHRVSILGVYKDGQLSSEAWGQFGPGVERFLGGGTCEVGFDSSLAVTHASLAEAIEDYARSNGLTDDLLSELAPAARGDLIMVLTASGRPPVAAPRTSVADVPKTAGGMGGAAFAGVSAPPKGAGDHELFQLSALFFSVAQGRAVARVDLQYSGASTDDAVNQFTAKLSQSLPGSTCSGWNWPAERDAERIRRLSL
ncbi:MAG TPA: hypothetical protein VE987_11170 [Polyangiaceae bacterium]|nr:hypothetical protein [Polyangiaceae bacterium]